MDSNVAVFAAQISAVVCSTEKAHWPCFCDRKSMQLLLAGMKYHNPARQTGKRGCKSWCLGVRQVHRVCQRVTESEICFLQRHKRYIPLLWTKYKMSQQSDLTCIYVSVYTCTIHCVSFEKRRDPFSVTTRGRRHRQMGKLPLKVSRQPWLNTIARQKTRRPKGRKNIMYITC